MCWEISTEEYALTQSQNGRPILANQNDRTIEIAPHTWIKMSACFFSTIHQSQQTFSSSDKSVFIYYKQILRLGTQPVDNWPQLCPVAGRKKEWGL